MVQNIPTRKEVLRPRPPIMQQGTTVHDEKKLNLIYRRYDGGTKILTE